MKKASSVKPKRRVRRPAEDRQLWPGACRAGEACANAGGKSEALVALHSPDDRNTFALLLLPFLLIAASVATSHRVRQMVRALPETTAGVVPATSPAVDVALLQRERPSAGQDEALRAETAEPHLATSSAPPAGSLQPDGGRAEFGLRLAAAARSQTGDSVRYSAKYQSIAYPMGDISPWEGACSDVIIRAYRALGIDLQELVHLARVGTGDASIDHRRTETLRKFFALQSASLPVTAYPEDYLPGDIVTYYRPFSRVSRAHIAIVSDVIAPTRRPMIVHNRGWGVQLEDALFVDQITGHYRYTGEAPFSIASRR